MTQPTSDKISSNRFPPRRAVWCGLALLILCLAAGAVRFWSSPRPALANAPAIHLAARSHDFGTIPIRSKAQFTFHVINTLPENLVIDRVARSCGCTGAKVEPPIIAPGGTLSLHTELSTGDHAGPMASDIVVYGHAGKRQVIGQYSLRALGQRILNFPDAPGSISLGTGMLDQLPFSSSITVKRGRFPLRFDALHVECDPKLSPKVEPISGHMWRVSFSVASADALGATGYPVTFKFSDQGRMLPETVEKQAYLEIRGPVLASPASILFTLHPGEKASKVITIAARPGKEDVSPPKIVAISTTSVNAIVDYQPQLSRPLFKLNYTAPTRMGNDHGQIIASIQTHGRSYKIRISYLAIISE